VALGLVLALAVLPDVAPLLADSLSAPQPKAWWYLSRASGLASYALLSISMLLGLLLSTRLAKEWPGGATAFVIHEHMAILGLAFGLFHALVLLGDRHTTFTLAEILLPFGACYRPLAVGMGQIALYGMAVLVGTSYVRKRIGQRVWRWIHFGSFAVFVLASAHAVVVGTDRTALLVGLVPLAGVLFLAVFRILAGVIGMVAVAKSAS
jgi:predicted ferric reductase